MENLDLKRGLTLEELGILETEMAKHRKSKDAAWGLWAGLHFFGAHRFYTDNYMYASLMLATNVIPVIAIILLIIYTQLVGFSMFLLWVSIILLAGSLIWSWIDAFFLNRRIKDINETKELEVIKRIKGMN
jgi:TM2 domain-containing membrane protein YozV